MVLYAYDYRDYRKSKQKIQWFLSKNASSFNYFTLLKAFCTKVIANHCSAKSKRLYHVKSREFPLLNFTFSLPSEWNKGVEEIEISFRFMSDMHDLFNKVG